MVDVMQTSGCMMRKVENTWQHKRKKDNERGIAGKMKTLMLVVVIEI